MPENLVAVIDALFGKLAYNTYMKEVIKRHHISFKNAFRGVISAFKTQPNFRVHVVFSLIAVVLGWYVELSTNEWILLTFTIFWGLTGEMVNTAIESITDLVTTEWRTEAKIAKDVSAGMMLLIAVGAVLVGVLLIVPKLVIKLF